MQTIKEFILGALVVVVILSMFVLNDFDETVEADSKNYHKNVCMWIATDGEAGWPDYRELGITKEDCEDT